MSTLLFVLIMLFACVMFRTCDLCDEPSHFDSLDALTTHKRLYHPHIPFNRDVQSAHRTPAGAQADALPPVHLPAGERWGHLTVDGILRTEHMVEISGHHQSIQRVELLQADRDVDMLLPSHLFDIFNERRRDLFAIGAFFLQRYTNRMKVSVGIHSIFQQLHGDPPALLTDYARAPTGAVFNLEDLSLLIDKSAHHLWQYIEDFLRNGSGWQLQGYASLFIDLYKLPALHVGQYQMTPRELRLKRNCITNVKSNDDWCFKWSIVAGFVGRTLRDNGEPPLPNCESVETYENCVGMWSSLTFDGIAPGEMTIQTAKLFEINNPGIALNVYVYPNPDAELTPDLIKRGKRDPNFVRLTSELKAERKAQLRPMCISKHVHDDDRMLLHLLMLEHPVTGAAHMVTINSLEQFFIDKHCHTNRIVCPKCFHSFGGRQRERNYKAHVTNFCSRPELDQYNVDFKEDVLEFKSSHYFFHVPFQIIGDFETYTQADGRLNHSSPRRTVVNRQEIMGFSLAVITTPEDTGHVQHKFEQSTYNGPDAGEKFIEAFLKLKAQVQAEVSRLRKLHKTLKPLSAFTDDELILSEKRECHICEHRIPQNWTNAEYTEEKEVWEDFLIADRFLRVDKHSLPPGYWNGYKVIDHCHFRYAISLPLVVYYNFSFSGKIRGAAHSVCNMGFQWRSKKVCLSVCPTLF